MKKIAVFLFCLFPVLSWADEEIAGKFWQRSESSQELKGILFLGSWDQVRKEPRHPVYAAISNGVVLLDKNVKFLRQLGESYLGKEINEELMEDLKCRVAQFYKIKNQPFVAISIPRQQLSQGVLQVVVEEAKLGRVTTQGNQHYTPSQIRSYIRAKPGEPLDMTQLTQDLSRMNQNPFRRTDAILRAGKKADLTDLELVTIDRWPYRIYAGADNTGTSPTDRDRIFFGFNFGKNIVKDGDISYQFTCAPNWNLFYAHTLSCHIPTFKRQTLILFGGYSQVELKPGSKADRSTSWQIDARYRFPVITNSKFLQEILVGYDFKQVDSRIVSGGADINQFMIGYDLGQRGKLYRVSFTAELYGNPGGITTRNKAEDYQKLRYAAGPTYAYLKFSHALARKLAHDFWFSYDINGQVATKNLLPSEQLTLAGYHAVRGFEERVVSVDNGVVVNTSLETPRISLGKSFGITKKTVDELYFLLFFDSGWGGYHKTAPNTNSFVSLGSIGPGVRYQIDRWLSAHLEYGFQLWDQGFENPTQSRYNFGLTMSY